MFVNFIFGGFFLFDFRIVVGRRVVGLRLGVWVGMIILEEFVLVFIVVFFFWEINFVFIVGCCIKDWGFWLDIYVGVVRELLVIWVDLLGWVISILVWLVVWWYGYIGRNMFVWLVSFLYLIGIVWIEVVV